MDLGQTLPPPDANAFGNYEIMGELARGGQGIVYEGYHRHLRTSVAIKVLLDGDPKSQRRFRQEAQVLSRLEHPNLIKVANYGDADGRPYLALEFVTGRDLKHVVREDGIPALEWSVKVMATIALALQYCHENGIVHRDLKPGNVLIEKGSGRPVVVDFGLLQRDPLSMQLSQDQLQRLTVEGATLGTPSYMAPEQADRSFGPVGPSADVYALGATLYFCLTGQSPYKGAAAYNVLVKLLRDPPPDPREVNPAVPEALARLCMRSMSKVVDLRPHTARTFAASLMAIDLTAPSPRARIRRRKGWRLAAAGVGALAGVFALGAFVALGTGDDPPPVEPVATREPVEPTEPEPQPEPQAPARPQDPPSEPSPFATGSELFDAARYAEALPLLRKEAEEGNAVSMYELALMHGSGNGVPMDKAEASKWLRQAANLGHPGAMFHYGVALEEGLGVEQNEAEAESWYHRVLETPSASKWVRFDAGYRLRDLGKQRSSDDQSAEELFAKAKASSSLKSYNAAFNLFQRAANKGHTDAMVELARLHFRHQDGVSWDEEEGVTWSRRAAKANNPRGMLLLAAALRDGLGKLEKDRKLAAEYFRLALEHPNLPKTDKVVAAEELRLLLEQEAQPGKK